MISTADRTALDPETCRRARLARDPRFDGEFFLAVRTTGIYCRPVCPARPPAENNVSYYRSAAQAARDGYRPCLRCRPESAPNSPAWNGTSTTVARALELIRGGALNGSTGPVLAARLGVGERYLRKLFERELGVSPAALALNQRLLFAKKLLAETAMPMTDVAFAAGFSSVRRFNSAVKSHFRMAPGALRRHSRTEATGSRIRLQLQYRPPYDWDGVLGFFARHAVAGVESVGGDSFNRHIAHGGTRGHMRVSHLPDRNALQLELDLAEPHLLMSVVANVRRMFDLDANPSAIAAVLRRDELLRTLADRAPGVRAPGHWSLFESAVRAIVGQQVSTTAARGILGRLAAASGEAVFPRAQALAALDDSHFPMPAARRDTLRALCRLAQEHDDEPPLEKLAGLRGVGPWTLAMVAMRGAGDPDAMPLTDLGIIKAWRAPGESLALAQRAPRWAPWRSYAANLLWRSL